MARLRVGDIEIDGANVSIGGVPQVPGAAPAGASSSDGPGGAAAEGVTTTAIVTRSAGVTVAVTRTGPATTALARRGPTAAVRAGHHPDRPDGVDGLAALPVGERALVGGGALLAATGGTLLALTGVGAALVLVMTGIGAVALGFLKRAAVKRRDAREAALADRELAGVAERVRGLLAEPRDHQTVEWVVKESGLDEAKVIRTLALLRRRGEVTEELNTDTGEWYYAAVPALPGSSLPLDERLALMDGAGPERKR